MRGNPNATGNSRGNARGDTRVGPMIGGLGGTGIRRKEAGSQRRVEGSSLFIFRAPIYSRPIYRGPIYRGPYI